MSTFWNDPFLFFVLHIEAQILSSSTHRVHCLNYYYFLFHFTLKRTLMLPQLGKVRQETLWAFRTKRLQSACCPQMFCCISNTVFWPALRCCCRYLKGQDVLHPYHFLLVCRLDLSAHFILLTSFYLGLRDRMVTEESCVAKNNNWQLFFRIYPATSMLHLNGNFLYDFLRPNIIGGL